MSEPNWFAALLVLIVIGIPAFIALGKAFDRMPPNRWGM